MSVIGSSGLFPPAEPFAQFYLDVSGGHSLYVEECGNPLGMPAVVLHGGPGAGCSPQQRRFFDPQHYRIILFDQRGAGRSTPQGSMRDNTTDALVSDIECLRLRLGVDRWLVFGGSWGSTLALAYAAAHTDRCAALVLRGIWLARAADLIWQFSSSRMVFPDIWARLVAQLSTEERNDVIEAFHKRLFDPDPLMHRPAALAWRRFELCCSGLRAPGWDAQGVDPDDLALLALCRIEVAYFKHRAFLAEGSLLAAVARFRSVPAVIIHGRYDMLCPLEGAAALSAAWPEADFQIVPDAGHSAFEPGITMRLIEATNLFATAQFWTN